MIEQIYIDKYKSLGLDNMKWFYIPFSIDDWKDRETQHFLFSYPIELVSLLKSKNIFSVLEVGTARGKTGTIMAMAGINVISIDIDYLRQEYAVLSAYELGCKGKFEVIRGYSQIILSIIKDKSFDAVFVDGDHSYQVAFDDTLNALRIARNMVIVHDVDNENTKGIGQMFINLSKDKVSQIIPTQIACDGLGVIYL